MNIMSKTKHHPNSWASLWTQDAAQDAACTAARPQNRFAARLQVIERMRHWMLQRSWNLHLTTTQCHVWSLMHQKTQHQDQYRTNLTQEKTFCLNGYFHCGPNDSHNLHTIGFDGITTDKRLGPSGFQKRLSKAGFSRLLHTVQASFFKEFLPNRVWSNVLHVP